MNIEKLIQRCSNKNKFTFNNDLVVFYQSSKRQLSLYFFIPNLNDFRRNVEIPDE